MTDTTIDIQEQRDTMRYSVAFKNISENDQLVLRLIFSLSAKARNRNHAYCLFESDAGIEPDICIAHALTQELGTSLDTPHTIWLGDDEHQPGSNDCIISKPLIASRVLNVLDRYIRTRHTANVQPQPVPVIDEVVFPTDTESNNEEELVFCISEEEASQLAIVDDETLSNPANLISTGSVNSKNALKETDSNVTTSVTTFVTRHNNNNEVSDQAFENQQEQPVARPRALVVDDSPSVRKQIELELDLFNVDVDFAESVADAQAKLQDHSYDVAFLDVVLPDGDGFSICRKIKTGETTTTVIILTGKATAADKIRGSMAGCDAYLVKPVGRMTFQNTVCNYLQLREQLEVIHG